MVTATLDAASDNNVAEIGCQIRCLFCTPPALQENQKVWFHYYCRLYGIYRLYV
jgi:hypothetical protein